jgi:hypothetical protein
MENNDKIFLSFSPQNTIMAFLWLFYLIKFTKYPPQGEHTDVQSRQVLESVPPRAGRLHPGMDDASGWQIFTRVP